MDTLDIVFITDEPMAWEGDWWKQYRDKHRQKMLALSFSGEEGEMVCKKYGVSDYFVPIADEDDRFIPCLPHRPHLGVCDLAVVVRDAGFRGQVVDNVTRFPERTKQMKALLSSNPKAVGLSTTFILTPELVQKYVRRIREITPDSKIILGGPTIRRCHETHPLGDYIVFGDGEDVIVSILEAINGDRSPEDIPYIAYKGDDGKIYYSESAKKDARIGQDGKPYLSRNTKIPKADWTLVGRNLRNNVMPIEFSRGCRYGCTYCTYDRGKYARDLESIREELLINAKYGITKYRLSDANFTDGPSKWTRFPYEVCQLMIDLDLGLEWSCFARANDTDDELAGLMKRAGCFAVCFGIESGDDRILKKMHKGHSVEDAHRAIRICKDHGMYVHSNFIVGYPGETRETFENTLEFIERVSLDTVSMTQLRVTRNTFMWGMREKDGLEGEGLTWRHNTMDSDTADELMVYGMMRLINQGICMGHELGFPLYMGLGLTAKEAFETMKDMHIIIKETKYRGEGEFEIARQRLRDKFLNIFPKAVAEDQDAWRTYRV